MSIRVIAGMMVMVVGSMHGGITSLSSLRPSEAPAQTAKLAIDEPVLANNAPIAILTLHGLGGNGADFLSYCKEHTALNVPMHTLDFPHSSKFTKIPHLHCAFAQEASQKVVVEKYKELVSTGHRVLLWGESDGAATATTVAGCYDLKNLAGLVLISPYADPFEIFKLVLPESVNKSLAGSLASSEVVSHKRSLMPVNPSGPTPVKIASAIAHTVPALVVASEKDALIPWQETGRVPEAMKQAGHPDVNFVVHKYGTHANLPPWPFRHRASSCCGPILEKMYCFTVIVTISRCLCQKITFRLGLYQT